MYNMKMIREYYKSSKDGKRQYLFVELECPCCKNTHEYQAASAKRHKYTECKHCRITTEFVGTKTCVKCKVTKDINEFTSTKKTSDGKYSRCAACRSEDAKTRRASMTKEEKYAANAASTYGISKEEAINLRVTGTTCGICKKALSWDERHLDHCHTTGNIRGILCPTCNKGLGSFYDNIEYLKNAIKWIELHD